MAFACCRQIKNVFRSSALINNTWTHRISAKLDGALWLNKTISYPNVRMLSIQVQETPNPNSIKFLPGRQILDVDHASVEFKDSNTAQGSPLAESLFKIEGVKSVFFGQNFITVTKYDDNGNEWHQLKENVLSVLSEYLESDQPILLESATSQLNVDEDRDSSVDDDDTVDMIRELIETRIRPTVQEDGGDIIFKGFRDGVVKVKLLGACSSCPSSVVTLKRGVENMLQFYIPEVQGVEEVEDEIDAISKKEFEKLEKTLEKPN